MMRHLEALYRALRGCQGAILALSARLNVYF